MQPAVRSIRETDLTRWQKPCSPSLDLLDTDIKTRTDDTTLVQPAIQFNNDLARPVIIDVLKLTNVSCIKGNSVRYKLIKEYQSTVISNLKLTVLLHDDKELDDDLGRRPDHDLPLPTLLSVVHALESVIQHADSHHTYLKNNKQ